MQKLIEAAQQAERITDRERFLRALLDLETQLKPLLECHGLKPQEVVPPPLLDDYVPTLKKRLREQAELVVQQGESAKRDDIKKLYDLFVSVMKQYRVSSRELEYFRKRRRAA